MLSNSNNSGTKVTPFVFRDAEALIDAYCEETRIHRIELTRKQKNALRTYGYCYGESGTAEDAPFRLINSYVRDVVAGETTAVEKEFQQFARIMYEVLEKHSRPIKLTPLYRGTETIPKSFYNVSIGDIIAMNQFVSMTNSSIVANSFSGSNGAMLIINNASGFAPDNSAIECEYIGQAGSHFRIDKIYPQDWFSCGLEHNDVKVFEVTMLETLTPIPHLTKSSFNLKFW